MRAAPPVQVVLASPRGAAALASVLAAAAAASGVAWCSQRLGLPWVAPSAAAAALLAFAATWRGFGLSPPATLTWDAHRWTLRADTAEIGGELTAAMDLGAWMLLRFRPDAAAKRSRWMATSRRAIPDQWHALRCAVYSPRPVAEPAAAGPQ